MAAKKRAARAKSKIMFFNGKYYKVSPLSKAASKKVKSELRGTSWLPRLEASEDR